MAPRSLPQRVVRAVGDSQLSERVARAQHVAYRPLIEWVRHSRLFATNTLGHSLHPPLTDVTTGCWLAVSVLDVTGGTGARHGALVLGAVGFVAAVPTALAGAGDWGPMTGTDRRIGAVHALGMDAATFLALGSLIARVRGDHRLGVGLALAANLAVAGAGFLGGHLALNRGTAHRPFPTAARG